MVIDDLLFNVVFGRLTPVGVRGIIVRSGRLGLEVAILHHIATDRFFNYPALRERFDVSSGTLRERVQRLLASGFLLMPSNGGQFYYVSSAGRAFLRLCQQIERLLFAGDSLVDETQLILELLDLESDGIGDVDDLAIYVDDIYVREKTSDVLFRKLARLIVATKQEWDVDWNMAGLKSHPDELDSSRWMRFG